MICGISYCNKLKYFYRKLLLITVTIFGIVFILTSLAVAAFLADIGNWHFFHDEKIVGPYRLQAGDQLSDMTVDYLDAGSIVEKIPRAVFEFGSDDNFIVAADHPVVGEGDLVDKDWIDYYYIVRNHDAHEAEGITHGPLDAATFAAEKRRLGLPPFSHMVDQLK